MRIQKRTMNWMPRPSLYEEAEAARLKRRANARAYLNQAGNTTSFFGLNNSSTSAAVDLTMSIAVARVRAGVNTRPKKLA